MVRWPHFKASESAGCLELSRMSQMPAHFFSKDPKPTNFLLFFSLLKPYVCSCLTVPGRVRLFVPVHHEVFGAVSRGASVCYVLSAKPFLPCSLSCPVTFKTHCLPFCCSLLHLPFSSLLPLSFIALCPSPSGLCAILSSPWWLGGWQHRIIHTAGWDHLPTDCSNLQDTAVQTEGPEGWRRRPCTWHSAWAEAEGNWLSNHSS